MRYELHKDIIQRQELTILRDKENNHAFIEIPFNVLKENQYVQCDQCKKR